jgi:acyl-CoA synthetase (AMP-forming)/AMP-acid ligase II
MGATAFETDDLATIDQVLDRAAVVNGSIEAYVEPAVDARPRRSITFAAWRDRSNAVAAWLHAEGVGPNDVVCVLLGPSIDFAVAYQGIVRVGAVTTGINTRMGAVERDSIFDRLRPLMTIVDDDDATSLPSTAGRIVRRSRLATVPSAERPNVPPRSGVDVVAVVWTSGTTGLPKGALFSHDSLRAVAEGTDVLSQPGDRRLSPLPFSHVSYVTRAWDEIAHGVTTIICPSPWQATSALDVMRDEAVTVAQGVPTQWALMLELDGLTASSLPSLRVAGTGAARMAPSQVAEVTKRLGVPLVVRYTSTETSLGTGTRPGDDDETVATTVGRPVSGVSIEIVDEKGAPVSAGQIGRVRLRSNAVMLGYVAPVDPAERGQPLCIDEERTRGVRSDDGWISTGDFGRLDEAGNLHLVGRDNEMYQRGGYNVYPAEVEQALDSLGAISQVAVVAAEDPILGEVGVAFIVPAGANPPSLDEVRDHVAAQLADYKRPDALEILDSLPVTPMGKVDKRALAAMAAAAAQRRSSALATARHRSPRHTT